MKSTPWRNSLRKAQWKDALLAVLGGNVIHFLLIEPRLPERLRHHIFQFDSGLGIDFLVCLSMFAVIRLIQRR
jgi:hypothetical protein